MGKRHSLYCKDFKENDLYNSSVQYVTLQGNNVYNKWTFYMGISVFKHTQYCTGASLKNTLRRDEHFHREGGDFSRIILLF